MLRSSLIDSELRKANTKNKIRDCACSSKVNANSAIFIIPAGKFSFLY